MNIVISYPKSGMTWTMTRILAYLFIKKGIVLDGNPADFFPYVIWSHLGFASHATLPPPNNTAKYLCDIMSNYENLFVLSRNSDAVMRSIWDRDSKSEPSEHGAISDSGIPLDKFGDPMPADDFGKTYEKFYNGPFGIKRYNAFLDDVKKIKHLSITHLSYEDMFDWKSAHNIPLFLGEPAITDEEAKQIFEMTNIETLKNNPHPCLKKYCDKMINRRHINQGRQKCH